MSHLTTAYNRGADAAEAFFLKEAVALGKLPSIPSLPSLENVKNFAKPKVPSGGKAPPVPHGMKPIQGHVADWGRFKSMVR